MANLIDNNKWTMTNAIKNGDEFTITNGKMSQAIAFPSDEIKYKLEFNCSSLTDLKSYFLLKVVALDGKHTYLVPVTFVGENSIEMVLVKDIKTIEVLLIGSLQIENIGFYENGVLTESQKTSIDKVVTESDKWDRIVEVTNEQGNLIAERLEGGINNALNTIFGGNGTMEMIDGTIIFRDKKTDAESTMAMRLNYGGLAIADSKKADGSWDWKTFGTGQGFTADYLNTGTLSAITIDGVDITGTNITGGKIIGAIVEGGRITGAVIDGGTTQDGVIKGYIIEGSTIYGGNKASGNYVKISNSYTSPFEIYNRNKLNLFVQNTSDRSCTLVLKDTSHPNRCIGISSEGFVGHSDYCMIGVPKLYFTPYSYAGQPTQGVEIGDIRISSEFKQLTVACTAVFEKDSVNEPSIRTLGDIKVDGEIVADGEITSRTGLSVLNSNGDSYIRGDLTVDDLTVKGSYYGPRTTSFLSLSELEIQNMELQYKLQEQGLKQSELEVSLMERGVL